MSTQSSTFITQSAEKAADREHRRKIHFNISRYNAVVPLGKQQFTRLQAAREQAKNTKWRAIETLDKQLETFEANITKRGAKVIWAETADDPLNAVLDICRAK